MYDLLRTKTLLMSWLLIGLCVTSQAQFRKGLYMEESDLKNYHIGIVINLTQNSFHVSHHPTFLMRDTVFTVNPDNTIGLGLGGMHTFRISERLEARVVFPQLLFVNKSITYNLNYPDRFEGSTVTKNVESILIGVPVQLKLRSDRIGNFRVYMMGGFKYETDLSSKSSATNADDQIKLRKGSFGIEAGMGFNFYNQYFILSPELKISNGIGNVHSRDPNLKYSNVIDRIQARQIVFSLIFEG
jgi:hypothetical protein